MNMSRRNPHYDLPSGPGIFEVGSEVIEVPRNPRSGLSPRSPGFGDRSSTSYVEPAPENTDAGRARARRQRRMKWSDFEEETLGRSSAGTPGDVDAGGLGVSERSSGTYAGVAAARRLSEAAERVCRCSDGGDPELRKGGCGAMCAMADRHEARQRRGLTEAEELEAQRRARLIERERPVRDRERRTGSGAFRDFLIESGDLDHDGRPVRHHDHQEASA